MIEYTFPSINYLSGGIGEKKIPGFYIECPDKEGFIYAVYDNQTIKVMLFHNESEKVIDVQPCLDDSDINRLLEINAFREVDLAMQMMYDNDVYGTTISWKPADKV